MTQHDLSSLETPAILIDGAILSRNIARAAEIARNAGVKLYPHAKTHKSLKLAAGQIASGASGLTVAKSEEAVVFLDGGVKEIIIAHPLIDARKIGRVIEAGRRAGGRVRFICDSMTGVEALGDTAAAQGVVLPVLVKIDVGLHRCGVQPEGDAALDLARAIIARPSLRFAGILSHAGHSYSAEGPEAVRAIAEAERVTMITLAGRLRQAGIEVPCISVGSTPTVWLGENFEGVTEIRPGNSVFMDLTQLSLGVAAQSDLSLSVLATIVSINDRYAIIDAGSKVLSSDRGPHGSARISGFGLATPLDRPEEEMTVSALSEEHGFVVHEGRSLKVGDRLRIRPNHACPVANLARFLTVLNEDGSIERWDVDARACTL